MSTKTCYSYIHINIYIYSVGHKNRPPQSMLFMPYLHMYTVSGKKVPLYFCL